MSRTYRNYVLAILTAVYTLNLVDRGLIGLLLQPIKEDLHLSDTQLGLVTGIVFGLFYALLGLPIARWSDRGNRVLVTALAIGSWGATVMITVLVANYAQLLLARMAAAVGEAGCKPPTYSLVGDYFTTASERTRAMAIYWMGSPIALILSFMLGGWLNQLYGWRMSFFLMGIPGLILAFIVRLTIIEPREGVERNLRKTPVSSLGEVLRTMWVRRSCRHLCIAVILVYAISYGLSPWCAAFLMRSHHLSAVKVGFWLGLILSLGGIAGLLLGGYVANRWFSGDERGQLRLSAIVTAAVVPSLMSFLLLPRTEEALLSYVPVAMTFIFFMGPVFALLQRLVPADTRATVLSIVMLLANLIGMGAGPQLVGILSDRLTPALGTDSLRYAMLTLSLVGIWAAWHFWVAGRTVAQDLSLGLSAGASALPATQA